MKKSEITVTMPISSYEELINIKTEYENLVKNISECYDTSLFKMNSAESVRFDYKKAESFLRKFIPYSCRKASITF